MTLQNKDLDSLNDFDKKKKSPGYNKKIEKKRTSPKSNSTYPNKYHVTNVLVFSS